MKVCRTETMVMMKKFDSRVSLLGVHILFGLICMILSALLFRGEAYALSVDTYVQGKNFPGSGVSAFGEYRGDLYVGTLTKGIFVRRKGEFTPFAPSQFSGVKVNSFTVSGRDLYIGTESGLFRFDGKKVYKIKEIASVPMKNVYTARNPRTGELFVVSLSMGGGLVVYSNRKWRFLGGEGKGLFNDIRSFAFDGAKTYLGSLSGAVYVYRGKDVERTADAFLSSTILSLAVLDGKLYVGTAKGLYMLEERRFAPVTLGEGISGKAVLALASVRGTLYLGMDRGVVKRGRKKSQVLGVEKGLPSSKVVGLYAGDETLLAGTLNGFSIIRGW